VPVEGQWFAVVGRTLRGKGVKGKVRVGGGGIWYDCTLLERDRGAVCFWLEYWMLGVKFDMYWSSGRLVG
jgi:hypothetical protein